MDKIDPQAILENFRRNVTEHYFDMKGRVRRQEFWYFALACFVVFLVAAVLDAVARTGLLTAVLGLALLPPMIGLGARRLQDSGQNGVLVWAWAIPYAITQVIAVLAFASGPFGALGFLYFFFTIGWLISLVSLVAAIVMIYFWVQPGTAGPNAYGPDPKAGLPSAPSV